MELRLRLNSDTESKVRKELDELKIKINDEAQLILTETDYHEGKLKCKDKNGFVIVNLEDICYIESFGRDVWVVTKKDRYKTTFRIYQLEKSLSNNDFIRISNSVIIKRNSVEKIKPSLSSKFYLTLKNGDSVDVTRSYYYRFKEFYGI